MKKENNLYDEPEQEAPIGDVKEPEVNFVLGGQEPGPDMQEMDSGLSIQDSLVYSSTEFCTRSLIILFKSIIDIFYLPFFLSIAFINSL